MFSAHVRVVCLPVYNPAEGTRKKWWGRCAGSVYGRSRCEVQCGVCVRSSPVQAGEGQAGRARPRVALAPAPLHWCRHGGGRGIAPSTTMLPYSRASRHPPICSVLHRQPHAREWRSGEAGSAAFPSTGLINVQRATARHGWGGCGVWVGVVGQVVGVWCAQWRSVHQRRTLSCP